MTKLVGVILHLTFIGLYFVWFNSIVAYAHTATELFLSGGLLVAVMAAHLTVLVSVAEDIIKGD